MYEAMTVTLNYSPRVVSSAAQSAAGSASAPPSGPPAPAVSRDFGPPPPCVPPAPLRQFTASARAFAGPPSPAGSRTLHVPVCPFSLADSATPAALRLMALAPPGKHQGGAVRDGHGCAVRSEGPSQS
jgi:hypothetical protein